jgi:ABC-type Mn2+/Zn2+ transport system permease subunit
MTDSSLLDVLAQPYAQRALVASALVGLTCGVLGVFVFLRNMSMLGDALSHAVLPGVVVAFWVAGYSLLGFFLGALGAGLLAAVLITLLQRNVRTKPDAAIGIVFTVLFAAGVVGISALTRQQGIHLDLQDFLFGNVLGIANADVYLTAAVGLAVVLSTVVLYRPLFLTTQDGTQAQVLGLPAGTLYYFLMLLLAVTVVAALQSVGVILVVAMLILPPATAFLLVKRLVPMLILSGTLGVFCAAVGLLVAVVFNLPPGPAMVLVGGAVYAVVAIGCRVRRL